MSRQRRGTSASWLMRLTALSAVVIALLQASPGAGLEAPRVTVVDVTLPNRGALETLVNEGYIIDAVRGLTATVYATAEDFARLRETGYPLKIIGQRPLDLSEKDVAAYHFHAELTTELEGYAAAYPDICRVFSIGDSVQGRELWVILITGNPDVEEDEPEFKFIATMHGDEPLGTEMCLYFVYRLLSGYGTDSYITGLVDTTEIAVLPLMNPDGMEAGTRSNAHWVDLNRAFPAYPDDFTDTYFDGGSTSIEGREPEVQHVMQWTLDNSFVLSANFHTGAVVVNYPYDDDDRGSVDSPTPDDLLLEDISRRYAAYNPAMAGSTQFTDGISNGAAWYSITGGMQDWCYRYAACMDVTIELAYTKWPNAALLPDFWDDNKVSMFTYMEAVHIGVRGVITDRTTGLPMWARVNVVDNAQPVFTDPDVGDYHRLLLPGTYDLVFSAPECIPYYVDNVVVTEGDATRVDLTLSDGDVNQDGSVGAADVQAVVNAILGYSVTYDADVDGRGVSATDLQTVINRTLGRPLPQP